MKLLYCHVEFLDTNGNKKGFRGLEQIDLNLSATHVFSYDGHEGILCKRLRDKPLPENFWANGDTETNLYNVNVVAGKNGSGKSTVINYVIDLLYYIYLDFGRQQTNIPESARFDVEPNYNLLAFEENGLLYVVELLPDGSTRQKLEVLQVYEGNGAKRDDATARIIRGRDDDSEEADEFNKLFKATKIVYMMNNPTQRDYERNLNRQEGGLRNYFVYDCSLGANLGGQMAQFFPYEVYKQVKYLFDGNQAKIRTEIEKRIKKELQKPDELVMPRALRLRPRINMLEDGLIQKLTPSFPTDVTNDSLPSKYKLNEMLGELCCRAFAENVAHAVNAGGEKVVNAAHSLPYRPETKNGSVFEEQKHCVHAIANTIFGRQYLQIDKQITCCAVLLDGRIVYGSDDSNLRIWNPDTGVCLQTLKEHFGSIRCLAVLSDGNIVSVSAGGSFDIWDPNTGDLLRRVESQPHKVNCLAALSDCRIVSDGFDDTLRIWDLNTGECLQTIRDAGWIRCLAVFPDGRIVSGSLFDKSLRIWDSSTGECLRKLNGDTSITSIAVLPDNRIISGSDDGTLRIWNVDTGKCMRKRKGYAGRVTCLAVLPDGRIVSGSQNGTFRIWDKTANECISVFSVDTKHQFVDALRRKCIAYLDFLAAEENDDLFAEFDRVENEDCCFELPLKPDEEGASQDERLKTDEKDASRDERLQRFMTEFIQKYRYTCEPVYTIDFDWGLSSGEGNMLRLFSNLFHIFDRDYSSDQYRYCRIYNDEWANKNQGSSHACTSVMLFLDEADLTLHPEWQRRLIHVLTASLPLIYPNSCAKDMQLILSTHSPLLLGDIPRENICYLGHGAGEAAEETFGQNIHTLLKDSFFLDNGTVGEFASSKINGIAARLEEILRNETNVAKEDRFYTETYERPSPEELMDMRKFIDLVASGILRVWLEERWQKVSVVLNERMHSERAEIIAEEGEKLTREERRYILRKWLEEEKL